MSEFRLPDLGEGLAEAEILTWHVAPGDAVAAGQLLVSVETDKATVEVASPRAGRIARLLAAPGERLPIGAPLLAFEDEAAAAEAPAAPRPAAPPAALVGRLPEAPRRERAAGVAPAARALARERGVDLARVAGSGPGGAVTRADVLRAEAELREGFEPLRGVRYAMARNLERAGREVVPAGVCDEADVEAWAAAGDVMLRLVRAVAVACRAAPALHAWLDARVPARRLHARLDLAIAVETEDGLVAPVLRDAGAQGAPALRRALDALEAAARTKRLAPADLQGATFTLSNFGMLGGRYAQLVVVPPQVAILGAGEIAPRARVHAGALAARRTLPLSLSFDHRAATGAEAARFLAAAIADLERED